MAEVFIREGTTKYPFSGSLSKAEYGKWHDDGSCLLASNVQINFGDKFVVNN